MTRPNFSGVWRLNPAKSRLRGAPVAQLGMRIEHDEPHFVQAVKTVHGDGTVSLGRIAGVTTGEKFQNPFRDLTMRSTASWLGEELVVESYLDAGSGRPLHFRDHWSLCEDGNALRMEHRDDDIAGQLAVLERVCDGA